MVSDGNQCVGRREGRAGQGRVQGDMVTGWSGKALWRRWPARRLAGGVRWTPEEGQRQGGHAQGSVGSVRIVVCV